MAKIALCLFAAVSSRALGQAEYSRFYKSAGCSGTPAYETQSVAECEEIDGGAKYRSFKCNGTATEFYTYTTADCTGNATFSHRAEARSCKNMTGGNVWGSSECVSTPTTTTTGATVRVRMYNDSACSNLLTTSQSPWRLGCTSSEYPTQDSSGDMVWASSSSNAAYSGSIITVTRYDVADCPASATPTSTETMTCGACTAQGDGYMILDECPQTGEDTASFAQKSTTTTFVTVLLGAALLLLQK